MAKVLRIPLSFFLIAHGIAHLLATSVYWKLSASEDLVYMTTVLSGRLDLGETGIWIYGLLWLVAGLGTSAAGVGLLAKAQWTTSLLLAATAFSLVLCLLVVERAIVGLVIDLLILGALLLGPRLPTRFIPSTETR